MFDKPLGANVFSLFASQEELTSHGWLLLHIVNIGANLKR